MRNPKAGVIVKFWFEPSFTTTIADGVMDPPSPALAIMLNVGAGVNIAEIE